MGTVRDSNTTEPAGGSGYLEEPAFLGRPFPIESDPHDGPPRSLGMMLGVALICATGAVLMWRAQGYAAAVVLGVMAIVFGGGYALMIRHYIQADTKRRRREEGFYDRVD